ncbi:MAG: transcription-repair coupling factor [Acidobacteria bacterium]|nr:transcription-repair coupling factor [Acidobacteriota bacterium]
MPGTSASSLSLRHLLKSAAATTGLAAAGTRVAGLTDAGKAFAVAAAAQTGPAVVVVPGDRDIDAFVSDVRFFLGSLDGLSHAALDRGVLPLPSPEVDPYRGLSPHFDVASTRARTLHALAGGQARVVVASAAALLPRLPDPDTLIASSLDLKPGDDIDPMDLAEILVRAGFSREEPVDQHGEFSIRGGVADIFPAGDRLPVRLEFIGDTIESIRQFDPATQRSVAAVDRVTIAPVRETPDTLDAREADRPATFFTYLGRSSRLRLFVSEFDKVREAGDSRFTRLLDSYQDALARDERPLAPARLMLPWPDVMSMLPSATRLETFAADDGMLGATTEGRVGPPSPTDTHDRYVSCQPASTFHGRVPAWVDELRRAREDGETSVFVAETQGRADRVIEILRDYGVVAVDISRAEVSGSALLVTTGQLTQGFRLTAAALRLYAETDIFDEERVGHQRRASAAKAFLSDFRDLKVGDHVVHVDNGIGVFVGLKQIVVGHETREFMELRYAGDDKLFVPVDRLDLVQKFSGSASPTLDRLGGTTWEKAKSRVKKAMRDMADELLKLYAARKAVQGHAFGPDTHWQEEFELAFPYELTPDQATAVADIKRDMESPVPMDRLLCGDVGFGKTEVARRAAFTAGRDGRQVAVLAPTTVLALQHLKTLRTRFAAFPVRIDMVSRFRTRAEQTESLQHLRDGKLDILVGTHRLLAKDVEFRDLGLLVVDEEQRFGVTHKERIKQMRKKVDVLTMSATPIPRTLNMSLVGIRDMSVIETAPHDRQAVQTSVLPFDPQIIGSAIGKELERGGQVYFVHNRVESIHSIAGLIQRVAPDAKIGIGHGQMGEEALEKVMVDFIERRYDVLLATTIIENGLDIPNANTMIINRADRYGLGQLYQLRGRVGRSDRRAYAYLLIPPVDALSEVARKRLAAIKEFSALGSGFRIAALDLEIRGAGNLLGGEQSGHIEAIGFEMYTKLLEETIRELKGEDLEDDRRATVNLGVEFRIDESYIADTNQRLGIYRQVAQARTDAEIDRVLEDVRDRYGPLPESVLCLADHARIRALADRMKIDSIEKEGQTVVFKFRESAAVDPQRLLAVVDRRVDLRLVPPGHLKLDLSPDGGVGRARRAGPTGNAANAAMPRVPHGRAGSPGRADSSGRAGSPSPAFTTHRPVAQGGQRGPSWWTVRATAGEVTPGFTKTEVLKPIPLDPRAPDGLFARVTRVMQDLSDE